MKNKIIILFALNTMGLFSVLFLSFITIYIDESNATNFIINIAKSLNMSLSEFSLAAFWLSSFLVLLVFLLLRKTNENPQG